MTSYSKQEGTLIKCLQSHRRLVRTHQNPYTHETKQLSVDAQRDVMLICERMLLETRGSYKLHQNPIVCKTSFNSMLSMARQVISPSHQSKKIEIIASYLAFSCEQSIACVQEQSLKHIDQVVQYVLGLIDQDLSAFMKRIKLELVTNFCCRNSLLFLKQNSGKCYSMFMRYFDHQPAKLPLYKRNKEIVEAFSKFLSQYVRTMRDSTHRRKICEELAESPAFPQLSLTLKHFIMKETGLQHSSTVAYPREMSRRSHHSITSKPSFRSTPKKQSFSLSSSRNPHSSFRNSNRKSTLSGKMKTGPGKRLSCQPDLLRTIEFQKFYSNENSFKCQINEEQFSGDESEVTEGDNTPLNKSRLQIGNGEMASSYRIVNLDGFYQLLKINGKTRLVRVQDIKFCGQHNLTAELIFRLGIGSINTNCRIVLQKDDPIVGRRYKHQDIRYGLADRIRTNLVIKRSLLGRSVRFLSKYNDDSNISKIKATILWLQLSRRYNTYFFECLTYSRESRECRKGLHDTTMTDCFEEVTTIQNRIRSKEDIGKLAQDTLIECDSAENPSDPLKRCLLSERGEQYNMQKMNCSNRMTRYQDTFTHEMSSKLRTKASSRKQILTKPLALIQTKRNEYLQTECLTILRQRYDINLQINQQTKFNIDGECCQAKLVALELSEVDGVHIILEVLVLRRRTKKFIMVVQEEDLAALQESNSVSERLDPTGICPLLAPLTFKRTETYSKLTLRNADETECIIDRFTTKSLEGDYVIACLSYHRCFNTFSIKLYRPATRITTICTLSLEDIIADFELFIEPIFSFEHLRLFPGILKEVREGLEIGNTVSIFGKELETRILLASSTFRNQHGKFNRSVYLKELLPAAPLTDLENKSLLIKDVGMQVLLHDQTTELMLFKALPVYYQENLNRLLNPIKPQPMDMDYYRFCMADLRRLARSYQHPQSRLRTCFYMFVNSKLHKFSYNEDEVKVERYPSQQVCRLEVESATNKLPFFNEVLSKLKGYPQRRRLIQSLNVAYPALYLSR